MKNSNYDNNQFNIHDANFDSKFNNDIIDEEINEFETILKQNTIRLKEYLSKVLKKNNFLIDLDQIIYDAYILCKNTEYKYFNIQDVSIELLNNILNEQKNHDCIISIFVELVYQEIVLNEKRNILQKNHKKLENIVYKNFCLVYFDTNLNLKEKKELIIMNSFHEYYSSNFPFD
jgi:hypothetical protein